MKKLLKWLAITCLTLIALTLSVGGLLYVPAVQQAVLRKLAARSSEATGLDVSFESCSIRFPLRLDLHNALVVTSAADTLARIERLAAYVRLKPLFNGILSVKYFTLTNIDVDSHRFLNGVKVCGRVGDAMLVADSVALNERTVFLNSLKLQNADVALIICDTTPKQPSDAPDRIFAINELELKDIALSVKMPYDSFFIALHGGNVVLNNALAALNPACYTVDNLRLAVDSFTYAADMLPPAEELDFKHIGLKDLALSLDTVKFAGLHDIKASISECCFAERSGLNVKSMTGTLFADSAGMHAPSLMLETAASQVSLEAAAPYAALDSLNPVGELTLRLTALLGEDVLNFVFADSVFANNAACKLDLALQGNYKQMTIKQLTANKQNAFALNIRGDVKKPFNERSRSGEISYTLETKDIAFVKTFLNKELPESYRTPDSMRLAGLLKVNGGMYCLETQLMEGDGGKAEVSADYDAAKHSYNLALKVNSFALADFMPDVPLDRLDATLTACGVGFDPYHPKTYADIDLKIDSLVYGEYKLSRLSATAALKDNCLTANVLSFNPLAQANIILDGQLRKNAMNGKMTADIDLPDFKTLRLTEIDAATKCRIESDFETDLKTHYYLDFSLYDWLLTLDNQSVATKPLNLTLNSLDDTTLIDFKTGDLVVNALGNNDLPTLASKLSALVAQAALQLKRDSIIRFEELRLNYPDMTLQLKAQHDNMLYTCLQEANIYFDDITLEAALSPCNGLSVNGKLLSLLKDTLKIDTVRLDVGQDSAGLNIALALTKHRFRNQEPFTARINAALRGAQSDAFIDFTNARGQKGISIGVNVQKKSDGFLFHLYPETVALAFMNFKVNDDNFLLFRSVKDMSASIELRDADQAAITIHSNTDTPDNKELFAEVSQLDLTKAAAGFAALSSMKGKLNASLRYVPMEQTFMLLGDFSLDDFFFHNGRFGQLLFNATYIPVETGKHQIDVHALHELKEFATLSVLYTGGEAIDGALNITSLPLSLLNPFMPGENVSFSGALQGSLALKGAANKPVTNGAFQFNDVTLFAKPSASSFRFDTKQIDVKNNTVSFDDFKLFDAKNNAFTIAGTVADITETPVLDLQLTAKNLQPLETVRKQGSSAFGRLFADLDVSMRGAMQALRIRGNLHVLGNSNFTCLMPEATLDVSDSFEGLVTFTYFADTLPRRRRTASLVAGLTRAAASGGADVMLNLKIDPAVKMRIDLNPDGANHAVLNGGGELVFQYGARDGMSLNGRYTFTDGSIKYNIPVIPLTEFTVRNGSYIEWNGEVMNPLLNISAYTRVRSTVNTDGQQRMVDFNTGIGIENKLDNMSLQFLLEAPNDAVVQSRLNAMGSEERSKQAISLLVAGLYLDGGAAGTENVDVGQAINTLLQREIKNMLGNVLGDVPFAFDVNTYDGTLGMGRRIDYIANFYKTLFNERLKTELGLRYSTKDPVYGNRLLLNDVALEYRLDRDGARALTLFHSKDYESLFEGEIAKTGLAFSVQRKVKRLRDLFIK